MAYIAAALGLFYIIGAVLIIRRIRFERFLDSAIEKLTNQPEPDKSRTLYMAASTLVYGGAGLALLLQSQIAVWLLGAGLAAQAIYYPLAWRRADAGQRANRLRWSRAWNAGMFSAGAFAFAAYAHRTGVLT